MLAVYVSASVLGSVRMDASTNLGPLHGARPLMGLGCAYPSGALTAVLGV